MATVLLVSACGLAGCSLSGKPPLPKHASIEHLGKPAAGTDYAAVVENADVIYFPTSRAASGSKSEPAALLLEALEKSGRPYAVAWDLIEVPQQPLLDELQGRPIGQRDNLIGKISIAGNGRTQEHCRSVLRVGTSRQLALAPPSTLLAKVADRSVVAADVPELPRGFILPSDGWENYAEHHAAMNNREMAESFRTQTVRQQFAAERIVEYFHRQSGEDKLLVFGNESDLETGHGIPFYVAQKVNVRQVVLGPDTPAPTKAKLLTRRTRSARGGFEVVDRTPLSAHH